MAGRKCRFYKDGVHHFVFYGNVAECRCGHKLTRVTKLRRRGGDMKAYSLRMNMKILLALPAAAAIVAAAGCSSSSSSTAQATASTTTRPAATATRSATVTGNETFTARETGQAVVASNGPTYHLTFTGPVSTTGTFTPPNSNATHQTGVFRTADGNMAVNAVVSGAGDNVPPKPLGNCRYQINIRATYTVDGAKSTGKFAGATGHGDAVVVTEFYVPKTATGACNLSQKVKPLAAGAFSTFNAGGPLTIRQP